jgi:hypothetical protein
LRERFDVRFRDPFLPTEEYFAARTEEKRERRRVKIPYADVWNIIHRGCFLELCANPDFD